VLFFRKDTMSDILRTEIHLLNNGIKFSSKSENNPEIISDYYPPLGNNEGYKPLELFLISFGTCASGTILPLLKRMQKSIELYTMQVDGIRKTEHPIGFSKIILKLIVKSPNLTADDLQKTIKLAEEKFCPVWSMIKNNVLVETEFQIER
jgi:putative redox protein